MIPDLRKCIICQRINNRGEYKNVHDYNINDIIYLLKISDEAVKNCLPEFPSDIQGDVSSSKQYYSNIVDWHIEYHKRDIRFLNNLLILKDHNIKKEKTNE